MRNGVDQVLRQHFFEMCLTKEGKKKESSFNELDFEQMCNFNFQFFFRPIKKWSKTKLLQIEIVTHFYETNQKKSL